MSFTWKDWNKADKTLLAAFAAFLMALATHLYCPGNRVAEGFLFCAEAALVGGIADWFAVTALFRKPLGFPYHTAILPRRRAAFVKASVTMVQKEFFSRRKIFRHLERLHLLPMLLSWLKAPETKERLTHQLLHYMRDFLLRQDAKAQAEAIAAQVRDAFEDIEPEAFFSTCWKASYSPWMSVKKCSVPFGRFRIASRLIISVLAEAMVGNSRDNSCK